VRILEAGPPDAQPIVFLHGLAGLLDEHTFLRNLAEHKHVFAAELPGYGESTGEEALEDMLDFTLHGWDLVHALQLTRPTLIGHSLGGMIAAEMAALAPAALDKLVLVDAYGLWLDEHPIPDVFAFMPFEFGENLFHDQRLAEQLLAGASDLADLDALRDFFVGNSRRLGTAGKMLFPIPNRRLSKRIYRLSMPTLVAWGEQDRLIPPVYANHWQEVLPRAEVVCIPGAGHMLPYEQPEELARRVLAFLE
jgi:pimeloyl-ACP methyl ester carboxylesterase